MEPHPCTSSSESEFSSGEACSKKRSSCRRSASAPLEKSNSDPTLYDVSPQLLKHMKKPVDGYQASLCCRLEDAKRPDLSRMHTIMERVVGPQTYKNFIQQNKGNDKAMNDSILSRRIMDMMDMKSRVLAQQNELPKVFNKMMMSHSASKYQGALEAAEAEIAGVSEKDAEMAAARGVQKYKSGITSLMRRPKPKITVVGYIGCHHEGKLKEAKEI